MKKFKIKQKSNCSGFTLVELVITIAIVIILSVISVPIYRGYVDKAKYSEAYALIGSIISAQKAYYSEHGNFLAFVDSSASTRQFTCNETVLGIDARGNKYFTWFWVGGSDRPETKTYFSAFVAIPKEINNSDIQKYFGVRYTIGTPVTYTEWV